MPFTSESKERLRAGARASAAVSKARGLAQRETYERDPGHCGTCESELPYEKRRNRYCSSSCAATTTNRLSPKRGRGERYCRMCGASLVGRSGHIYCSSDCQHTFHRRELVAEWLAGIREGGSAYGIRGWVRDYLMEAQDGACALCGLSRWREQPIMLIGDHIDGNSDDHRRENVRLVCSNCDAQLPTYKARNKGHGRQYRRSQADVAQR